MTTDEESLLALFWWSYPPKPLSRLDLMRMCERLKEYVADPLGFDAKTGERKTGRRRRNVSIPKPMPKAPVRRRRPKARQSDVEKLIREAKEILACSSK